MAEKQPAKKKRSKRRLRNPETIREQAIRAQAETGKPKKATKVKRASKRAFRPVTKLKKPFTHKPFRVLGLVVVPPFLRRSWQELRLVTWPNRKESRQLTVAVVIFSIIFGVFVAIIDWGLDKLFKEVLLK